MNEQTEQQPSIEVPPPAPPKFKVDDMVELFNVNGFSTKGAIGQVIDPGGVDVEIFISLNPAFQVGAVCRGISENDLRLASSEMVDAFEKECAMYEAVTVRAVGVDVEAPPNDMAKLMAADIKEVLGDELTLERCEAVIKMTQAARDYLAARPVIVSGPDFSRFTPSDPAENLKRLHDEIGIGDPGAV